jgi:uncharacterized protein
MHKAKAIDRTAYRRPVMAVVCSELDESGKLSQYRAMKLEEIKTVAKPACERFRVRRLDAFGSTARGTANESSDVDLLVEFEEPERGLTQRFFGLLHYLEDNLGCEVDLLTSASLRNPYFRKRVMRERISLYEG